MEEARAPPDQAVIHRRIQDIVGVLMDFSKRREPGVQRSNYVSQLTADVCNYYGYNQDLVRPCAPWVRRRAVFW
jgi:ribosomal RNA methyltransferase Nop2